jgi:hypothetical protein
VAILHVKGSSGVAPTPGWRGLLGRWG